MNRLHRRVLYITIAVLALPNFSWGAGTVASVHPLATDAGESVFQKGGNAFDAAVATALALGVVDSHNSGIGGGCFILAHRADGAVIALDGREMAPAAAYRDMYLQDGEVQSQWSRTGPLAVGIPGSLAAYQHLLSWGGTHSLADSLQPAIHLAKEGFPLGPTLAARIQRTRDKITQFPATAQVFLDSNGQPWPAGHPLKQADLAQSLEAISQQGIDWFYRGLFAQKTGRWMASNNGIITADDFPRYKVVERAPIIGEVFGHTVIGFPPPSSGGTHVLQILTMLEQSPLLAASHRTPGALYHLFVEAERRAFADRARWLGDADFTRVPMGLTDRDYLAAKVADVDPLRATPSPQVHPYPGEAELEKHTTHLTVADEQGNWVAITTTLNTSFGSGVMIPGTGILLNNQMDDFSAAPGQPNAYGLVGSEANAIAPGKRPLSSMSPTLVLKTGEPVLAIGAAGGPTIITQVALALLRALYLEVPLPVAVAAPRLHHQWLPDTLFMESTVGSTMQKVLEEKGHTVKIRKTLGVTTAIIRDKDGGLIPVVEPRLLERK